MVYLSLGSNIGNRSKNILTAIQLLKENSFNIKKTSSLYETSPWRKTEQPDFLNVVIEGETNLSPQELFKEIKNIEKTIGRKPTEKWGPRTIDIDVLFYKKEIINTHRLKIPHPQLHKRAFVLIPLKEIAPQLIHPLLNKTTTQMLNDLNVEPPRLLRRGAKPRTVPSFYFRKKAKGTGARDKGSVVLYNKSHKSIL